MHTYDRLIHFRSFLGPTVGGAINDHLGFSAATSIVGFAYGGFVSLELTHINFLST